ncbi:MAG: glucokinase [Thermoanaerobaculaceae bacterium]
MAVVLAGDIGGTKALLALAERDGDSVRILTEARFSSPEYPGLAPIVREFMSQARTRIAAACFGVPGAVLCGTCTTPNLPWIVTEAGLSAETGLSSIRLINDFAAAAIGLLATPDERIAALQDGEHIAEATKAVLGAGTGLGQAQLFWDGSRYRVNPTEGGHGGFAPVGEPQRDLLAHLERTHRPVSVERVVSGPGLVRIYRFLVERGVPTRPEVEAQMSAEDPAAVIGQLALAHADIACDRALDLFVTAYGAEAGNLALRCLAVGGVYVTGGIAPKILPRLQEGGFMAAFRNKGRMSELVSRIPVKVVLDPAAGLLGAAIEACQIAFSEEL